MAVITTDKAIIIIVVTAVVIVLAYVFRFGRFKRQAQTGANPDAEAAKALSNEPDLA